jgi:beta-galactosidase
MACFSSVTCVDDFALAPHCDVFAASMNASPASVAQVLSAARGKVCYNVESHVNFGSVTMHQRRLGLTDLLADWLPQVGLGIKGFLFWQFRPEVLGAESPAWGVVRPDGGDRPVTRAVREFGKVMGPHFAGLMQAMPAPAEIGVWKSRKNELFHFAAHNSLASLIDSVDGYQNALYWSSYPYRLVDDAMLGSGDLDGLRVLIMPACYYLTEPEAEALDSWVRSGGVLLCEAHLGGYNGTTGRHSRRVPGCGLAERWGLYEADSTSSYHLRLPARQEFVGSVPADVEKALREAETQGGRFYPIRLADGSYIWGASRYAALEGDGIVPEGSFDGTGTCLASKAVGAGRVLYCGANLGEGAVRDGSLLEAFLRRRLADVGIRPTLGAHPGQPGPVHLDALLQEAETAFLVVINRSAEDQDLRLDLRGTWRGLFTGLTWQPADGGTVPVPAHCAEVLVRGD